MSHSEPDPLRTGPHVPDPSLTTDRTNTRDDAPEGRAAAVPAIPGYEIVGELGRGGMGIVYRARQVSLNREIALKTLLRADVSRTCVARFWAEAEVMAAVTHPHVVQVYELGEHDGRPFMAMEFVPGGTLAQYLTSTPLLAPLDAAALVEKIARGVAAAHDLGIVHRDLKPGNVLLASEGRKPPDSSMSESGGLRPPLAADTPLAIHPPLAELIPKVADFGLAKRGTADLTQTQAVMGTPAYMAPEQAAGRAKFVGPPADVWALGVILYECISRQRPFTGASVDVLLSQIQSAEPKSLRDHVRGLSRDLDTIAAKCLTKEADARYPTATELADDLGRYLRGEPILARPVGRAERLVRWARRKPTTAAAYFLSVLVPLLALLGGGATWLWQRAERNRAEAVSARDAADTALGEADAARGTAEIERGKAEEALGRAVMRNEGSPAPITSARSSWPTANGGRIKCRVPSGC